jgi:hypothetical protein
MLDSFGTGNVVNGSIQLYELPSAFQSLPSDGWLVAQWSLPQAVNVANYTANDLSKTDSIYGVPQYYWQNPGQIPAIALYNNPGSMGGGDVVQLTIGSTNQAPQGATDEEDMFLTAPNVPASEASLINPISVSLNAKVTSSYTDFATSSLANEYATSGLVFSVMDIGYTIFYNGAGGLPSYVGFVQIVPWSSNTTKNAAYESAGINPGSSSIFISSLLFGNGNGISVLPSDQNATPNFISYSLNYYAYKTIEAHYSGFSSAQMAELDNLANWSIGGVYLGLASNNVPLTYTSSGTVSSDVATISSTLQMSNIQISENLSTKYVLPSGVPQNTTVDTNPKISYTDNTLSVSGTADGGAYTGTFPGIQYEYLYNGYDNISLTVSTIGNWYFGGGLGSTILTASSGNNVLLASSGGSFMSGGTGNNTFIIQTPTTGTGIIYDTVSDFHQGDAIILPGFAGQTWTYSWAINNSGNFILSPKNSEPGLTPVLITFPLINLSNLNQISVYQNAATGDLTLAYDGNTAKNNGVLFDVVTNTTAEMTPSKNVTNQDKAMGIAEVFSYTGVDPAVLYAPNNTAAEIDGGMAPTILIGGGESDNFIASTGSSIIYTGSGLANIYIPDDNVSGNSTWDIINNFQQGDTCTISGFFGSGWQYKFFNSFAADGSENLTLIGMSTSKPMLTEVVEFKGLTLDELPKLGVSVGTKPTDLVITNTISTNTSGVVNLSTTSDATYILSDVSAMLGNAPISFLNSNMTLDSLFSLAGITGITGQEKYLLASAGGSSMVGSSGENMFFIPAPKEFVSSIILQNLTPMGTQISDIINNFHSGDCVILSDVNNSMWSYELTSNNTDNGGALTLMVRSREMPGLSEAVTFTGIYSGSTQSLSIASGAGALAQSLIVTIK